jgi:hypothetical protein
VTYLYLASPYSHPDLAVRCDRFASVCEIAVQLAQAKIPVYSPIMAWHPAALQFHLRGDAEYWSLQNEAMMASAKAGLFMRLDGWMDSKGMWAELEWMRNRGMIVFAAYQEELEGMLEPLRAMFWREGRTDG